MEGQRVEKQTARNRTQKRQQSTMSKKAMITGATGQDGTYAAEYLTRLGYQVHAVGRSIGGLRNAQWLPASVEKHGLNESGCSLSNLVAQIRPDEIYHFAADSFVPNGWERPIENVQSNYSMTLELLEAMRHSCPAAKLLNACSREIFGSDFDGRANEQTAMHPVTPYGINKAASRWMVEAYRAKYDLFATNAILFNHESPRRGANFVTRKVSMAVARIKLGVENLLELGSTTARRDWGFAGDFVEGMWRVLQHDTPEDFVLGTGNTHSIQDLVEAAFECVQLDWSKHVHGRPELARVNDFNVIAADATKARDLLQWTPTVDFRELVEMMVRSDVTLLEREMSAPASSSAASQPSSAGKKAA